MSRKLIAIAIAQAIGLSVLAYVLPTWQDEEFTLATTAHGVGYAIHRAIAYEHQAPFYFALVAALRPLSTSVFFAREISVALVVATTLVAAYLARAVWPQREPAVFCAWLALNPFVVFAALEIRLYALALLLQAVLFVCFFRGFYDGSSRAARAGFAVCATVAIYTQYFSALDVAGCCLALLVAGRTRTFFACVLTSLVPVVAFAPMLPLLAGQSSGAMSAQMKGPASFGGRFLRPVDFVFASSYGPMSALAATVAKLAKVVVPLGIFVAWPKLDRRFAALFSIFLFTHLAYATIELLSHRTLAVPRHFIALFFPEVVAFFALLACLRGPRAAYAAFAIGIAFVASDAAVLASTYASLAKSGDAKHVGAYLQTRATAGDTIAVFPGDAAPAIARYYAGDARVVGYPISLRPDSYTVDQSFVRSLAMAAERFSALGPAKHVWLVEIGGCDASDINGCVDVEAAARERYAAAAAVDFHGTRVYDLTPKAGPSR